jgi:hypothetical protein
MRWKFGSLLLKKRSRRLGAIFYGIHKNNPRFQEKDHLITLTGYDSGIRQGADRRGNCSLLH